MVPGKLLFDCRTVVPVGGGFNVGTRLHFFFFFYFYPLLFLGLGGFFEGLRAWKTLQNIGKACH